MSVSTRSIELNLSFKLRLNRFCAFETLSSWLLVGNFIHSFMASSYSKTCCEFHTHHDWLRLEEQTFDMSKREKWPEYHEHLWLPSHVLRWGNQVYFAPIGSTIWTFPPFSKKGCPLVWQPALRCDGGRKVTMDHVHENSSLLPFSWNLVRQVFSVFGYVMWSCVSSLWWLRWLRFHPHWIWCLRCCVCLTWAPACSEVGLEEAAGASRRALGKVQSPVQEVGSKGIYQEAKWNWGPLLGLIYCCVLIMFPFLVHIFDRVKSSENSIL